MNTSINLTEIVKESFLNPQNQIREENQKMLSKIVEDHLDFFVGKCASEFINESLPANIRVLMATALKLTIKIKPNEKNSPSWQKLSDESKEAAKMAGLHCLIDSNQQVRKAAANLTALIYVLDLINEKKFRELLDPICVNIQNENQNVRQTSIQTFGFICELLGQLKVYTFEQIIFEQLATGICLSLQKKDEATITAVIALTNSLSFLQIKFENEKFSDYVFNQLLTFFANAVTSRDWELLHAIISCLSGILKVNYNGLNKYHSVIFTNLIECLSIPNEKCLIALSEFFIKALRLESKLSKKYFEAFWQSLLDKTLMSMFAYLSKEHQDEDDLLENLIEVMKGVNRLYITQSYQFLLKFVQNNWESDKIPQKLTALCTFETMIESSPVELITEPLNQFFLWIINSIKNGRNIKFSSKSLDLLTQIAIFRPEVIFSDINFQKWIQDFLFILQTKTETADQLKLKIALAKTFEIIIQKANSRNSFLTLTRSFTKQIFDGIVFIIESNIDYRFIDHNYSCLFSLVQGVMPFEQMSDSFVRLLNVQNYILERYQGENKTMIYETNLIILNLILVVLKKNNRTLATKEEDPVKLLQSLFVSIDSIFTKSNHILHDGITLMTNIILHFPDHFSGSAQGFFDRYIKVGLTNIATKELLNASIISFQQLVLVFPSIFISQLGSFIEFCFILLGNADLPQESRLLLFYFLADITPVHSSIIASNLKPLLHYIQLGLDAVVYLQSQKTDSRESIDFCLEFREILIQNLMFIVLGVYLPNSEHDQEIENRFVNFQITIKKTFETSPEFSLDYVKDCLTLLNDYFSKKKLFAIVDVAFIKQMCSILNEHTYDSVAIDILSTSQRYGLTN